MRKILDEHMEKIVPIIKIDEIDGYRRPIRKIIEHELKKLGGWKGGKSMTIKVRYDFCDTKQSLIN